MTSESYAITPADMGKVRANYEAIKEAAIRHGCWAMPYALVGSLEAHNRALVALVHEAVKAEREACAKACDALNFIDNGTPAGARASNRHCAAAIRARSQ